MYHNYTLGGEDTAFKTLSKEEYSKHLDKIFLSRRGMWLDGHISADTEFVYLWFFVFFRFTDI